MAIGTALAIGSLALKAIDTFSNKKKKQSSAPAATKQPTVVKNITINKAPTIPPGEDDQSEGDSQYSMRPGLRDQAATNSVGYTGTLFNHLRNNPNFDVDKQTDRSDIGISGDGVGSPRKFFTSPLYDPNTGFIDKYSMQTGSPFLNSIGLRERGNLFANPFSTNNIPDANNVTDASYGVMANNVKQGNVVDDIMSEIPSGVSKNTDKGYFTKVPYMSLEQKGKQLLEDIKKLDLSAGEEGAGNGGNDNELIPEAKTANALNIGASALSGLMSGYGAISAANAKLSDTPSPVKTGRVSLNKNTSDFENANLADTERLGNSFYNSMVSRGVSPMMASQSLFGPISRSSNQIRSQAEELRRQTENQEAGINARIEMANAQNMNRFRLYRDQKHAQETQANANQFNTNVANIGQLATNLGSAFMGNRAYSDLINQGSVEAIFR